MKLLKNKNFWLLAADVLLPFLGMGGLWLSRYLLASTDRTCVWTLLGGKCLTCGGTHFARDLLSGHILLAFTDNPLLFLFTVFLGVSYVLLHLSWLWELPFAQKCLSKMYTRKVCIGWVIFASIFFIVRNIPAFIYIWNILTGYLS